MQAEIEQAHKYLMSIPKDKNMESLLTFTTELDQNECPDSYCLTGNVIDNDGYLVAVGEYTTKFDKAWNTLMFYTQNFKDVTVTFKTKAEAK